MQSKLQHFQVMENGKQIGQVFAPDRETALNLAHIQFPGKELIVILRDESYRTK